MSETISPYDILGVEPDDPIDVINLSYKRLVRSLHPDTFIKNKKDHMYVNGIRISREEASIWLDAVSAAYDKIKKTPRFARCPDTKQEYQQNNYDVLPYFDSDFDVDRFNDMFQKNHIPDVYASAGYSEFGARGGMDRSDSYPSRGAKKPPVKETTQIVSYYDGDKESNLRSWEIDSIENFNIRVDGKNQLYGSDLGVIYETSDEFLVNRLEVSREYTESGPITGSEINRRLLRRNL